jgi:hypothetical protein
VWRLENSSYDDYISHKYIGIYYIFLFSLLSYKNLFNFQIIKNYFLDITFV